MSRLLSGFGNYDGALTVGPEQPAEWSGVSALITPPYGGTLYLLDISGALTPAGALVRMASRALTGAIAPAGDLVRQTVRQLTGVSTPSGAIARQTSRQLAGSVTPSGSLTRQLQRALTAALTPAGVLVRRTLRALTGILGSSADVTGDIVPTPPPVVSTLLHVRDRQQIGRKRLL